MVIDRIHTGWYKADMATLLKEPAILTQIKAKPAQVKLALILAELHRHLQHQAKKTRTGCG